MNRLNDDPGAFLFYATALATLVFLLLVLIYSIFKGLLPI